MLDGSMEGGVGPWDEFVWAGQGMPGTNVPGQRGRGCLGGEGQGSGKKEHIGIYKGGDGM